MLLCSFRIPMGIERDQPVITLVNVPPTERSIFNGTRSVDVYSGFKTPHLGLATIAGVLRGEKGKGYDDVETLDPRFNKKGRRFKTDDAKFTEKDFERLAHSDVVGFTSMTRNREVTRRAIEWTKLNNPNAIVIVGGPDATFKPEKWLDGERGADYVVRYEGEKTIVELMNALKTGGSVENIKGISYKKDGVITSNTARPLLTEQELSDTSLPFFPENIRKNSDGNVVETKRGCPNRCEFCSVTALYNGQYRLKSDESVIKMIKDGDKRKITFFVDDNFAHKSRWEDTKRGMQSIIDAGLNDRDYFMQLDTVTVNAYPEFIKLAVKMGLKFAFLGIESIDAEVLRGMHKAATADQNKSAVEIFAENLVGVQGMEIMGSKNETRESIDKQKKWNKTSGINSIQVFPETPIVGSKLAEEKLLLPIAERDTNFIDGQHVVTLAPNGFTCAGLQQEIVNAYRDFYSLRNIQDSLKPLSHILEHPGRALELTLMNIAIRVYARNLLRTMTDSEYAKNYVKYLEEVDRDIYNKGKVIFEAEHHQSKILK